ncbi:22047_t:CDS:2, partial [Cetraspora pellucida]
SDKEKHNSIELHDYPKKPEIIYRDQSTSTYHYTIISEGYYLSPSILIKTQKKKKIAIEFLIITKLRLVGKNKDINNKRQLKLCFKIKYNMDGLQTIKSWQSATYIANLFAQTYNNNRTSTLSGTIIFRLQLKCVEQARDSHYQSNVLQPLEKLSNSAKRPQIKQIGVKVHNQDWIIDYSKDKTLKTIKRQAYVRAMDYYYISRDALQSIAKMSSELSWEYTISNEKLNIDNIMQNIIPFYIMNINIDHSTIFATDNKEIHIEEEEIIHNLQDIFQNGILDKFSNKWNVELYFSSDWKFLALCLGLNVTNATYFCPYCKCTKKEIGLYNKS